jgi:dTDP-4-dehydrorhamnose 3,5-epimerase
MQVITTAIPDVKIIVPRRFADTRGHFSETYTDREWRSAGMDVRFVQDNESLSVAKGVVRGLHYQIPPAAQAKLVRVLSGAILDVVVDIRRGSPTFGRPVSVVISAADGRQVFIPPGFAHGYVTLEANTLISYKVSSYYAPTCDRGIRWNDPSLAIDWGVDEQAAILSERDRRHPLLTDATDLF